MTTRQQVPARPTEGRDRNQAAESLFETAALQDAIFSSENFSIIATDAKGVVQIFNVGAERMLGYAAAEVVNRITPADMSDPNELIARAAALSAELGAQIAPGFEALAYKATRGIEDIYELTYIRKDQSRLPAMVSVTALRGPGDVVIGYLLIGTDNTARKHIEDERSRLERVLRHQNVELEAASRMKSEFLANMSHELRTPLNAIIGFSEILRDGLMGDLTDKQRGFIGDIYSSGQHLLSLINDILDLSKVEAGKMLLDLEEVPLSATLRNSLSIVREKAAARRIRLSMEGTADVGLVHVDARKVKQIVYNLLSNAVKFTDEGGQVVLRTAQVKRADVGLRRSTDRPAPSNEWTGRGFVLADSEFEDFLEISVTDGGIGIAPEGLDQLFKPFSQIDSGLGRKFEGTGLGLAMVKLLADLHGGTVAVESAVGKGSRFTVWLPLRTTSVEVAPELPRVLADHVPVAGETIALVVEDDERSAELIRVQLEAEGFTVLHASTAEAGLRIANAQPLALITLDIMLPGMDGWEFISRIKRMPGLDAIPVVIVSIVADTDKGFALGAAAVMQKPVSRKELYESLSGLGLLPLDSGRKLKVLVVDDDPKAIEIIVLGMGELAGEVLRADGGQKAIDLARSELPDLIVLDLMMPEVSGFDVVDALQANADTARIPVLVVTAKHLDAGEYARLSGHVRSIVEKGSEDNGRFLTEVRRAMSHRAAVVLDA